MKEYEWKRGERGERERGGRMDKGKTGVRRLKKKKEEGRKKERRKKR